MLNRLLNYWNSYFNKNNHTENYIVLASSDKTILSYEQDFSYSSLHQFTVDNFNENEFVTVTSLIRNKNRVKPVAGVIISVSLTEILNDLPALIINYSRVIPKLARLKAQLSIYVIITDFNQIAGFDSYSEIFNSSGLQLEFNNSNLEDQIDAWIFDIICECEAAFIQRGVINLSDQKYRRFYLFKDQLEILFEPISQFINNINSKCGLIKFCHLHKLFLIPSLKYNPHHNIIIKRMTFKLDLKKCNVKYVDPEPNVMINFNLNEIFDEHYKFGHSFMIFRLKKLVRFTRKYFVIIIAALALIIYLQVTDQNFLSNKEFNVNTKNSNSLLHVYLNTFQTHWYQYILPSYIYQNLKIRKIAFAELQHSLANNLSADLTYENVIAMISVLQKSNSNNSLVELRNLLAQLQNLNDNKTAYQTMIKLYQQPNSMLVHLLQSQKFNKIAWLSWQLICQHAYSYLNVIWQKEVIHYYRQNLENKYPLNKNSSSDSSLNSFRDFFSGDGTIEVFVQKYLSPLMTENTYLQSPVSSSFLTFLSTLHQIQHAYIKQNSLVFSLDLQPIKLSEQVKLFSINDGQQYTYQHGPQIPFKMHWSTAVAGQEITIHWVNFNDHSYYQRYQGPWALFRWLQHQKIIKNNDSILIYLKNNSMVAQFKVLNQVRITELTLELLHQLRLPQLLTGDFHEHAKFITEHS